MTKDKNNPGVSAAAAAPARVSGSEPPASPDPAEQVGAELATKFRVRQSEVAILRLENNLLRFLYPEELKTAGSIPLSSSSAVAAHTAQTKKVELFNNFTKVKHVSIFETIKLGVEQDEEPQPPVIQKLMSGPVLDEKGRVLGVIQVCRKGYDLRSAGPDFTLDDLQQLELAAKNIAKTALLRKNKS
jgi:hypothetical protein